MSTYESRGKDTNDALDPSAGMWTRIIVSVLSPPESDAPALSSASCSSVRSPRPPEPPRSGFMAAPLCEVPWLPVVGIASVRVPDAAAARQRYQPQPLVASR